jgi:biopolymer transport protein ExbB
LIAFIQAAGWPIWPLIACSIAALALMIERGLSLTARKVAPRGLVDDVISLTRQTQWRDDVVEQLEQHCVLGALMATGLRAAAQGPRLNEAALRQVLETAGRRALHTLERYLSALGTIASMAPLLGLLGTVVGMIEIFGAQGDAVGSANPTQLAHGISVALYNTAFGLIVAVPSLLAYRYFKARIDGYALQMEEACERVLPHLLRLSQGPAMPAPTPSA